MSSRNNSKSPLLQSYYPISGENSLAITVWKYIAPMGRWLGKKRKQQQHITLKNIWYKIVSTRYRCISCCNVWAQVARANSDWSERWVLPCCYLSLQVKFSGWSSTWPATRQVTATDCPPRQANGSLVTIARKSHACGCSFRDLWWSHESTTWKTIESKILSLYFRILLT